MKIKNWKKINNSPNLIAWDKQTHPKARVVVTKVKDNWQTTIQNDEGLLVDAKFRKRKTEALKEASNYMRKVQ